MEKKNIYAIVGATASGKSSLALSVCERMQGAILSCDSMQVYRKMNIGTAKPSEEDKKKVKHYLIDIVDPDVNFTLADYVEEAKKAVDIAENDGQMPLFCGGTGLYLDTFLRGGLAETIGDESVREKWTKYAEENGKTALHNELEKVDPESAACIHENNVRRVVRALEIFEVNHKTKTELDKETQTWETPYIPKIIGLKYEDKSLLYHRIDRRVDIMMKEGLLEEVNSLQKEGIFTINKTASQAIGYKELLGYLQGECSLEEAVERLKTATKHYAKRQMTWFRAKPYISWIAMDQDGKERNFDDVFNEVIRFFSNMEKMS